MSEFKRQFEHLRENRVLAAGHKRDSWFAIDRLTGTKVQTLSVNSAPEVCPSSGINQMFIGRTGTSLSVTRVFSRTHSLDLCLIGPFFPELGYSKLL